MPSEHRHHVLHRVRRRRRRHRLQIEERRKTQSRAGPRLARHLHVQPRVDEVHRVHRAPVRGHISLKPDLIPQDCRQRLLVPARERPVQPVVRAHDRRHARLHRCVERRHIHLVQRLVIDIGVLVRRVVPDIVLHHRHHVLRLDSLDLLYAHHAGQIRVLAERVVPAPKLQIAIDIHERLQAHVDPVRPILPPDHHSVLFRILRAEGRCHAHRCRLALARHPRQHPRRPVRHAEPRNSQPRNPCQIPRLPLVHRRILLRPMNQRDLFLERHPAQQLIHTRIARHYGRLLRRHPARQQQRSSTKCQPAHPAPIHVSSPLSRNSTSHTGDVCGSLNKTRQTAASPPSISRPAWKSTGFLSRSVRDHASHLPPDVAPRPMPRVPDTAQQGSCKKRIDIYIRSAPHQCPGCPSSPRICRSSAAKCSSPSKRARTIPARSIRNVTGTPSTPPYCSPSFAFPITTG